MSADNGTCVITLPARFGPGQEYCVKQIVAFQNLSQDTVYLACQNGKFFSQQDEALEYAKLTEREKQSEYGVVIVEAFARTFPRSNVFTVYTKDNCPYCVQAKKVLTERAVPFVELKLGVDFTKDMLLKKFPEQKTLPLILNDDRVIGGLTQLIDHLTSGDSRNG